jgi:hypothetical protein
VVLEVSLLIVECVNSSHHHVLLVNPEPLSSKAFDSSPSFASLLLHVDFQSSGSYVFEFEFNGDYTRLSYVFSGRKGDLVVCQLTPWGYLLALFTA